MDDQRERDASLLMRDLMFESLRVEDERLNALATELFARLGEQTVPRLVLQSCDRKQPPGFRVRALRAIRRVGAIPDATAFFDLSSLIRDRNAVVRETARSLLADMRQGTWAPDHERQRRRPGRHPYRKRGVQGRPGHRCRARGSRGSAVRS